MLFFLIITILIIAVDPWTPPLSATLQSIPNYFMGNCMLHGNHTWDSTSLSRQTSHSLPMYKDGRVRFLLSIGLFSSSIFASLNIACGACLLVRLVDDNDHFYLNEDLTRESKSRYTDTIGHQWIGSIMDIFIVDGNSSSPYSENIFLLGTYLPQNHTYIQLHYSVQLSSHPCPVLADETHQFLICSDRICHDPTPFFFNSTTSHPYVRTQFQEYMNPYFITIHSRNTRYPFVQMRIVCSSPLDVIELAPLDTGYGFRFPFLDCRSTDEDDIFYLECIDDHSSLFRYWITAKEILEAPLRLFYQGGVLLSKRPVTRTN